jgi:hypothetical protein
MQEEAAVTAREEEERRRHEAHLKKLQDELEAKKEAERRWVVINNRMLARCVQTLSPKDQCNAADRNPGEMCLERVHWGGGRAKQCRSRLQKPCFCARALEAFQHGGASAWAVTSLIPCQCHVLSVPRISSLHAWCVLLANSACVAQVVGLT